MNAPYPQQTHYAPPPPVYGRWKPWLRTAAGAFVVASVAGIVAVPAVLVIAAVAWIVTIGALTRGVLLARDEGRDRRASAVEAMTGARPYGVVVPVIPTNAQHRPRFWVLLGVGAYVVLGIAAYALLQSTAKVPTPKPTTYSGSADSGYRFDTITPTTPQPDMGVAVGIGLVTAALIGFLAFRAVQAHLRTTMCVAAPAGWWSGTEPGYTEIVEPQLAAQPDAGYGYGEPDASYGYTEPAAGYGYPEQHAPAQGYGYGQPAHTQPEPSSGDPLADLVNSLSDEDFDRLRAHFSAPSTSAPVVGENEPNEAPRTDEQPKPFGSTSSLDDLL